VDRAAEGVREHDIVVHVGGAGEVALEQLHFSVPAQRLDSLRVKRDRPP
jgi:hypothetical protein